MDVDVAVFRAADAEVEVFVNEVLSIIPLPPHAGLRDSVTRFDGNDGVGGGGGGEDAEGEDEGCEEGGWGALRWSWMGWEKEA